MPEVKEKRAAARRKDVVPRTRLGRFFRELHRRKIVQTLAAFIGGGWLILEFIHWILIDHYHLPEVLLDIALVTIIGLLLITLTRRWFKGREVGARKVKPERLLIPALVIATLTFNIWLVLRIERKSVTETAQGTWLNSIAVLPFADLSPARDQEYFCEGMAEDIRTKLTKLDPRLKVIARYAMLPYRDGRKSVREIALELGVKSILEGSVQREGNRIRVNAQLIDAASGAHIWAELYDREAEKVFDVQDEISLSIIDSLKLKLASGAANSLKGGRPQNFQAYEYFLRGLAISSSAYAQTGREQDFERAVEMYRKALELDPGYGRAYAGLAWIYNIYFSYTGKPELPALVMEYCQKAYEQSPDTAEGQAAGGYYYSEKGDLNKAFSCFRRALALNPNMMEVLHVIGLFYSGLGLYPQAARFYRKVLELSPGFILAEGNLGHTCLSVGDLDCAGSHLKKVKDFIPNRAVYIIDYANLLIHQGRFEEAEDLLNRSESILPALKSPDLIPCRAILYAAMGKREAALALASSPEVYALLGMKDKALEALKRPDQTQSIEYTYLDLLHNKHFDSLRQDPQFQTILASRKAEYDRRVKKYGNL
jgi:adenylate cyclase